MAFSIHGLPVSPGIAIGHVHLVSHALLEVNHYHLAPRHLAAELKRFDEAVISVEEELRTLRESTTSTTQSHTELSAFVDLQLIMLKDPLLITSARELIEHRGCNAEWALVQQMEQIVAQFDEIEDPYLRERQADVVHVVERLVKALLGQPGKLPPKRRDGLGTIVVAHDLSPTDTFGFRNHNIAGFVTDLGGPTSHTAIVARSLKIPAVVGLHHIRDLLEADELVIIDGSRGVIIIDPDPAIIEEYQLRRTELEIERSKLNRLRDTRAATLDGEEINFLCNIEGPQDLPAVKEVNADGIGLFRTEFLFIGRDSLPDEEEQFEVYRSVIKAMAGKPVTIRSFDIGADKPLKRALARSPLNPALGLRGVRYALAEPQLFLTQLRALLRASAFGTLQIMIPMLADAQEIDQCLALLEEAKRELRNEKISFDEDIAIGGMIEIPAAALSLGMFIRRLSFLSLGTNDLIQYTLAVDRADESVAHLYDPLHPGVLKLIATTLATGARHQVPVSICGEMAGDPAYTLLLLGMGLRHFSVHPSQLLELKQQVLHVDLGELTPKVQRLLKLDEPARLREGLERLASK